ncbi:pentatricopeptide repeat-containing protein At1g73400, mitochondrial-like [Silene latifolia]|uniref:pentatricopeptide repeat-containing protein At1g73400, mitochondrial-like n=1 Tax=Silene latifolia TaxID=37657 RepID=UPI003D770C82
MWRSSCVLILRQSGRLFNGISLHDPYVIGLSRATTICLTSPMIVSRVSIIPDYANYFGLSRDYSCDGRNDFGGDDDCGIHGIGEEIISDADADMLHKIVTENSGFDKNIEKALDQAEIGLTTELVVKILHRLRFDEKVAFRFFMWAARQENYQHEYKVYNEMIDILSSTKLRVKQFRVVCDVLDYMKRNNRKSVPIEVLLTILRKYTEKHMTEIMKCSRKKKRVRVKKQPEINAFNLLLDALCKCGLVDDAEILFKKMRSKLAPNATTFSTLFFGWCRVKNPKRGMEILEGMTSMGFSPDSFIYNAAIDSFCKAGMVSKAIELFEFLKSGSSELCPPTANTYAIIILVLVKNDRIDDSFKVVEDMIHSGCLPDVSMYKKLIEGMCLAGKVEEAYRFLEEMAKKGYPPDIVTYNCFLKVLCDNKKADEVARLYGKMCEVGCTPSIHSFNMILEMFFTMGDLDGAFYTWSEMDKKGCDRDVNSYCVMIEGLFESNKIENACLLLEEVVNKGIKLPYEKYDLFLMHLSEIGDLRGIQCLSAHMKTFYNPSMARRYALNEKRKSLSLRG